MAWWGRKSGGGEHTDGGDDGREPTGPVPPVAPVGEWPDPVGPARYEGARLVVRDVGGVPTPVGTVQVWAGHVRVGVLWPSPAPLPRPLSATDAYDAVPQLNLVVRVTRFWLHCGPDLRAQHRGTSGDDGEIVTWQELATKLGVALPWWAHSLRRPELILAWTPGAPMVTAAAASALDLEPLYVAAAGYHPDHPTHRTLTAVAGECEHHGERSARTELDDLRGEFGVPGRHVIVAADPASTLEVVYEDLDEATRRAGWAVLLERADPIAEACIEQAMYRDGGQDFPASYIEELVYPYSEFAREWIDRLVPASMSTAHRRLNVSLGEVDPDATALHDPATDAPVLLTGAEEYRLALPQRLPTLSPLTELILDEPVIWVRVADGTLYPAPSAASYGVSWGYSGGGPSALAVLTDRLLDDITAHGAESPVGAPRGLDRLFETKWPVGTVLTRRQLEEARAADHED